MNLIWKCNGCGEPVADGDGYLECHYGDIHQAEKGRQEWDAKFGGKAVRGGDLLSYPDPARWRVWHRHCDPNPSATSYWMDIARVRTQGHLLDWTAHLMGKRWLNDTNWDDLIRSRAGVDA